MAGLLGWLTWKLLPSDQKAIQKTMVGLVEAASVNPTESGFKRLAYPDRLASFFTTNATLHLEGLGADLPVITGRTDLLHVAAAARLYLRQADFDLADLYVTFPPETGKAKAYAVITGQVNSGTNRFGQAFRVSLRKVAGRWLIQELNAVDRQ